MTPNNKSESVRPETPAYDFMRAHLNGQSMSVADALGGGDGARPMPDRDPDGEILTAISEGNVSSFVDQPEQVSTLAALNYSIEMTADALEMDVDEVEALAGERLRDLMRLRVDEATLPGDDDLWRIYHIIFREEHVEYLNIAGVKDVAEQIGWTSLVEWIEANVETDGEEYDDYTTWLAAVEEAVRHEEADDE